MKCFAGIRALQAMLLLSYCVSSLGCALCSNPFDCDYVTYGSRTPRSDMKYGRVGSPFSDVASGTLEGIQAIDNGYAEVLEDANFGPVFQDEQLDVPSVDGTSIDSNGDQTIRLSPSK